MLALALALVLVLELVLGLAPALAELAAGAEGALDDEAEPVAPPSS